MGLHGPQRGSRSPWAARIAGSGPHPAGAARARLGARRPGHLRVAVGRGEPPPAAGHVQGRPRGRWTRSTPSSRCCTSGAHFPGTRLSGGEQQMLAIARVLRMGARLLLCSTSRPRAWPAVIVQQIGEILRTVKARGPVLLVEQNVHFAADRRRPALPAGPGPGRGVAGQRRGPARARGAARRTSGCDAPCQEDVPTADMRHHPGRRHAVEASRSPPEPRRPRPRSPRCGAAAPPPAAASSPTTRSCSACSTTSPASTRTSPGKNSVEAVEMAIADFKAKYGDKAVAETIEVVTADHQNKPDIANTKAAGAVRPQGRRHRSSTCRPPRPRSRSPTWPRRRRSCTSTSARRPPT